jgi:hypothetical protein
MGPLEKWSLRTEQPEQKSKMKYVNMICISLAILLTGSFSFAQSFKIGSEPEEFRGIKWERDLSTLSGMKYYRNSEMGGSFPVDLWDFDRGKPIREIYLKIYLRKTDKLKIGKTELERIEYGFWREKFCEATITIRGSENWASFRGTVFDKFGRGRRSSFKSPFVSVEGFDWYIWMGKIAEMELMYRESSQVGKLWVGSTLLREQIFKEVREKAKEP